MQYVCAWVYLQRSCLPVGGGGTGIGAGNGGGIVVCCGFGVGNAGGIGICDAGFGLLDRNSSIVFWCMVFCCCCNSSMVFACMAVCMDAMHCTACDCEVCKAAVECCIASCMTVCCCCMAACSMFVTVCMAEARTTLLELWAPPLSGVSSTLASWSGPPCGASKDCWSLIHPLCHVPLRCFQGLLEFVFVNCHCVPPSPPI